jgi:hypothetical protein
MLTVIYMGYSIIADVQSCCTDRDPQVNDTVLYCPHHPRCLSHSRSFVPLVIRMHLLFLIFAPPPSPRLVFTLCFSPSLVWPPFLA